MARRSRVLRFLSRIPWLAVVAGTVLGIPLGLALGKLSAETPTGPSFAWQLSLGVILGGITGWIIPEVVNEFRYKWRISKPLREMLGPLCDNKMPTTIFLASLYPTDLKAFEKSVPLQLGKKLSVEPHHGMPWVVTEGDAIALGYVMGILGKAGRTENVAISRDDAGVDLSQCNLICIGSPKSNLISRQIDTSFTNLPFHFAGEGTRQVLRTTDDSEVWRANDTFDYGVVVKTPNNLDDEKSALVLAGISFVGTAGAAYYFWQRWREIAGSDGGSSFGFVLRVRRDNYQHVECVWSQSI
jgi:hypothetical protein